MRKIILGLCLICVSLFSTAAANPYPGIYNIACVRDATSPELLKAHADTNTGVFILDGERYNVVDEQQKGTESAITYKSQYTNKVFLLLINGVDHTSKYMISDGTKIISTGVCMLDTSVLI